MRPNWFSSALEKRNFQMLTIDGVFYFIAATFLDATIVIPLFLEHISGSPVLVGIATAIRHLAFVLPQLVIARWCILRPERFVFRSYLFCRFSLCFVLAALLHDPTSPWVLISFFIAYLMFAFGEGITQVPWIDLFDRTIAPHNHGRLFGLMQTVGAIGAFVCGLVIQQVLSRPEIYPYPNNFIILFALAFVFLFVSTLSFRYVRDDGRRSRIRTERQEKTTWRKLSHAWRHHRPFRTLIVVQMLTGLHQLAMPFYILYVQGLSGVGLALIGTLVIAQIAGNMAGGMLFGTLSSKWGNAATIRVTVLAHIAVPVSVLAAGYTAEGHVQGIVLAAFFLMGLVGGGWIGFTNYLLEISTEETRGRHVAFLNACTAPLAMLPVFSGSILSIFSYQSLFAIVLILLLAAFWMSLRLPTTIRHRRGSRAARSDRQTNAAPQ